MEHWTLQESGKRHWGCRTRPPQTLPTLSSCCAATVGTPLSTLGPQRPAVGHVLFLRGAEEWERVDLKSALGSSENGEQKPCMWEVFSASKSQFRRRSEKKDTGKPGGPDLLQRKGRPHPSRGGDRSSSLLQPGRSGARTSVQWASVGHTSAQAVTKFRALSPSRFTQQWC